MKKGFLAAAVIVWIATISCVTYDSTPVANKMMEDAFVADFVQKNCGYAFSQRDKEPEARRRECSEKWASAFTAKLQEVYPEADFKALSSRCDNSPRPCEPEYLEQWAHDSHFDRLEKKKSGTQNGGICFKVATPCD